MTGREWKASLRYAGAFIGWVIGSGFATGQEILQFFGSYGVRSLPVLLVNLIGFAVLGVIQLTHGHDHRDEPDFNHYEYYCGRVIGKMYAVIVPVTLLLIIAVLISAAGATLKQYYGIDRFLGSGLMAALILATYLVGFERLMRIVSGISPLVILFVVLVGGITVIRDRGAFAAIGDHAGELAVFEAAPHWSVSAFLYLSLNFLCGSTYYTAIGRSAVSRRAAGMGALIGSVALLLTIAAMNYAILLNAGDTTAVSVPTLYLAARISPVFGVVFFVTLFLGMFASCATTVWSFCSGFFRNDRRKNRLFSAVTVVGCLGLGFFPFGKLMAVVYPLIGYAGLLFIGAVLYKGLRRKKGKGC